MNGESQILQRFKNGFAAGRLGHAYLIVGDPRGNAARLAESVQQMIFCGHTNPPCGECNNCRRVAEHIHPDSAWIEPIKKSRGILVEQIKVVIKNIFETTFEGGWKAVVLLSAERMNNEAANKLLKTLEEPPPRTMFLLLTDQPEALLPTIVSRCQRITLSEARIDAESELHSAVVGIATGLNSRQIAAKMFQARETAALLKNIKDQVKKEESKRQEQNQSGDEEAEDLETIKEARIEAVYRERRREVLKLLLLWQRDLLLCASGIDADDLFFFSSKSRQIHAAAAGLTPALAMRNVNIVEDMQAHLDKHLPEFMVIERAFLQLTARSEASERAGGKEGA